LRILLVFGNRSWFVHASDLYLVDRIQTRDAHCDNRPGTV